MRKQWARSISWSLNRTIHRPIRRALVQVLASALLAASLVAMSLAIVTMSAAGPAAQPQVAFGAMGTMGGTTIYSAIGAPPDIAAATGYVLDADNGAVLYTKDADAERPMASTTKVMTALLAVERGRMGQAVTVGADAAALVRRDSSYMGLKVGEQLTLEELLYGLLLPSGNDAAVAIADSISGNQDAFVALMNQRARELGLTHTHYTNPHGLDAPEHYTSARDLAVLAAVALREPEIVKIASTPHYSIPQTATHPAYELETGNDLLADARSPYPGAIGLKPGFTGDAGYTMAFAARRDGHLIVGAVLGDPSWQVRIVDMRALLDWGFVQIGIPAADAPATDPGDPAVLRRPGSINRCATC
jgi:D-alanyl-D-alanine carboxypeptidase (penicillin-binding protein 5/6)